MRLRGKSDKPDGRRGPQTQRAGASTQQGHKQTLDGIQGPTALVGGEAGPNRGWRWLGKVMQVEVGVTASLLGRK